MITPIRALTIEQICERKDDLLVSNDDIHKLAKHVKEQAIDKFAERLKQKNYDGKLSCFGWHEFIDKEIDEIAEQMKGEQNG